jgi:integrase
MPTQKLNEDFVKAAQAVPGAERTIYWDETLPSFGLMVTASGARSFVCQYRATGVSRRLTLKAGLSLKDAKKEALGALGRVAKGGDPLAERRKEAAAATNTLKSICEEYLKREGRRLRTADERRATFERLLYPKHGSRQIETIRRSEINSLLDKVEDERGPAMADHLLAYLRRVMNWHASRSDDFRSPIVRGMARTKAKERARGRVLSDDELRAIWRTAAGATGPFAALVQFLLLTCARRSEAAKMTRSEVVDREWTLPAARNKVKVELVRPLSPAALAVLASLPNIGHNRGHGWIFTTDGERPINGFSKSKRAFDKLVLTELQKSKEEAKAIPRWTLHDLRRTARSLMSGAFAASTIGSSIMTKSSGPSRRWPPRSIEL